MTRVHYLKGRAAVLRRVAKTIDVRSIRDRVLALAEECVQLAKLVEKDMREERTKSAAATSRLRSRFRKTPPSPRIRPAQRRNSNSTGPTTSG
jgi:hypothetical protein